jgi:dTDP-4-amino-4,6-dideoxygalactose transaminase
MTETKIPLIDLKRQYLNIKKDILQAIIPMIEEQQFILNPCVEHFEEEVASWCGVKKALGVSSGSDALLMSLIALDIGAGDEVITTPFTFFATAGSIARLGAKPVFIDIDPIDFNICADNIEDKISLRTKAIIPVHLFGQICNIEKLLSIADHHGIPIIEDAAQAIGAKCSGKMACSFGKMGCLSFFPSKNLGGFGDGGMILTNDEKLFNKLYKLRVHGMGRKYYHDILGGNFRLDSIQAAVLSVKFKHLKDWTDGRRKNAEIYNQLLRNCPFITLPIEKDNYHHVYNQYVIRILNRDYIMENLKTAGICTEIYYPIPLHLQTCFSSLGYKVGDFPFAEEASRQVLALPIFPELSKEEINKVCNVLLSSF